MHLHRTGLLIIRAWVERDSTRPLRAHIRATSDVSDDFQSELTVADKASVKAVVETWLEDVLEEDFLEEDVLGEEGQAQ